jgi:predicted acylesterase/phospholipase RssA
MNTAEWLEKRPMKRILTLDGGGIRGVFSLQILARIEELLRQTHGRPDLVLADVFHLIAGTSTGALIATFLSWGLEVREIERFYVAQAGQIFCRSPWYRWWKSKYRADAIASFLRRTFSEDAEGRVPALLGSKRLRTLLLIVMRNAATGSPWPVSNNRGADWRTAWRHCPPTRRTCRLRTPPTW